VSDIAAGELERPIAWRLDLIEHGGDAGAVSSLEIAVEVRNVDMDRTKNASGDPCMTRCPTPQPGPTANRRGR